MYFELAFVLSEIYMNYRSVLSFLQELFIEGDILNLIFAGTDCEKAFMRALEIVFFQIEYGLYI